MLSTINFLIFIGLVWFCAYKRFTFPTWASIIGIALALCSYLQAFSIFVQIICWVVYLALTLLFGIPSIRHQFLTKPVLGFFRRVLPPMSSTEREAIEAGDVWWEGDLFSGSPDWKKLHSYPKPVLTEEEQNFVNNQVETLCSMINDWLIVQKHSDLPPEVWAYIKKEKFFGMIIPKQYGGLGFSASAHSCVVTKIATRSVSTAVSVMVPNSLGPGELLVHYGTDEQKNYYLPRLATAEEIPCFALTGESAGSDAAAMTDIGVICKGEYQGQEVLGARMSWNKRYITLAPIATVVGLAVKLRDPEGLLGKESDLGITLFLIPATHPGVEIGHRHFPMNMAFMNGPIHGNDVFVPLEMIIGGPSMIGQGWRMLMECLSMGRGISLPALSAANAQLSYRMTGVYARVREQFKIPIGKFEGVQDAMADIAGYAYMQNATRIMTAGAVDLKIKPAVASAITKYHMTETLRKTLDHAMDIHAGRGIQFGPRNYLGQGFEATPIAITVEGANILTRSLIIFGQGAIRCHPYILKEIEAAQNANLAQGFETFDKLLVKHIGFGISNFARAFWMGLTGGKFVHTPVNSSIGPYYRQLTRMSTALALTADISMLLLGGELKRKESLSARLGDVLSQLYLASAVLKYFYDLHSQPEDVPYVEWCLQTCLAKIQIAFDAFFDNFPVEGLGTFLKFIVFPYGRSYNQPSDKLSHKLAAHMMTPSALRDRLTNLIYYGEVHGNTDAIWRMENAFKEVLAADPIYQRIHNAVKSGAISASLNAQDRLKQALALNLITQDELNILDSAETVRMDALRVDDFAPGVFVREKL
ncbi:MAG: fadE [Gammaproteobacteria bacterium]|jgi:alkylation response protein AidB-like acyl-CoA dehydrogenase|nr:fadE [Gammaproteobacteria bacterium]